MDNYYIIDEAVKCVIKELTLKKYKLFQGIASEHHKGFARIYVLASEIVAYTDNVIDVENLAGYIKSYQNKKVLSMEELWNITVFLQLAIIESIRDICEKIYISCLEKYKVESIIERLVEQKTANKVIFKPKKMDYTTNMQFTFIEHLSYRLKKMGKISLPYLNILEEEVRKMGMTLSDVIRKEHFDLTLKRVSMGNAIRSLKELSNINLETVFEQINEVEEILKQDPAQVYNKMDYKTKRLYRNKIEKISKKTRISEIYIANKVIELCNSKHTYVEEDLVKKEAHVGYYLIDEGIYELKSQLLNKKIKNKEKSKPIKYISTIAFFTLCLSIVISFSVYHCTKNISYAVLVFYLAIIPASEIVIQCIQYILSKAIEAKSIPKMDMYNGIDKRNSTFVVIPTIIKDEKRVKELFEKLEVYYLANKSENIYFAVLGDASESKNEKEDFDLEVTTAGIIEAQKLNKKYNSNKFYFLYRKRVWNNSQEKYLGWERKRGLLYEFNRFLIEKQVGTFTANTITNIPNIKYVITLDVDTRLPLNAGLELIGGMTHILNKPELSKNGKVVLKGYGVIQPRVGIDILSSRKSLFTKIFAGSSGTDLYSEAISDVYQDNFGEGIFTGKGIYDLEIFHKIFKDKIPENTVLSHDLLEGSFLRAGLATDIMLIDGFPYKYNAYMREKS